LEFFPYEMYPTHIFSLIGSKPHIRECVLTGAHLLYALRTCIPHHATIIGDDVVVRAGSLCPPAPRSLSPAPDPCGPPPADRHRPHAPADRRATPSSAPPVLPSQMPWQPSPRGRLAPAQSSRVSNPPSLTPPPPLPRPSPPPLPTAPSRTGKEETAAPPPPAPSVPPPLPPPQPPPPP